MNSKWQIQTTKLNLDYIFARNKKSQIFLINLAISSQITRNEMKGNSLLCERQMGSL